MTIPLHEPETEHRFNLLEEGPPHEHDTWHCDCGAWFYRGNCAACGDSPATEDESLHCFVWCYALEGMPCIEDERRSP